MATTAPYRQLSGEVTRAPLIRPRKGRMLLGLCQMIANYFGWNVWAVRAMAVVGTLLTVGLTILLYPIISAFIRSEPRGA